MIHDGKGNFQIYGYPKEIFPPTDFHTATPIKGWIYIIGCGGYPEQRVVGQTPIYRLKLESWEIEAVKTSGDMPSWLHRHRSKYEPKKNLIHVQGGNLQVRDDDGGLAIVPNEEPFELDLSSFRWRRS